MGIRSQKLAAEACLKTRDRTAFMEWADSVRNPFRVLLSLTYDQNELVQWRAIEATGWVVAARSRSDNDKARDTLRRLFWQMNDESGGLTWRAPELIGESLVNVPVLIPEYADLLLSFLREEPFERGTHCAVCRLAHQDPKPFAGRGADLADSLGDADPAIRAYSALTLGALKNSDYRQVLQPLLDDDSQWRRYDLGSGNLETLTVGEAARAAVDMIDSTDRAA